MLGVWEEFVNFGAGNSLVTKPKIFNTQPSTRNPQPSARNPQPSTLNPQL
jgi:hypothetical protein